MSTEKKEIKISGVIELLHSGLDRKAINEKLGLTPAEAKVLWKHPSLLGRKRIEQVNLEIIDDAPKMEVAKEEPKAEPVAAETHHKAHKAEPEAVAAEEIPAAVEVESPWDRK